jgi:hypothetical protein
MGSAIHAALRGKIYVAAYPQRDKVGNAHPYPNFNLKP